MSPSISISAYRHVATLSIAASLCAGGFNPPAEPGPQPSTRRLDVVRTQPSAIGLSVVSAFERRKQTPQQRVIGVYEKLLKEQAPYDYELEKLMLDNLSSLYQS